MRLQKTVAYHSSRGVPVRELSDRCDRTLDRAARHGPATTSPTSAAGTPTSGPPPTSRSSGPRRAAAVQQAIRFNLFCLAQAAGRDGIGVPAKGVTGSGYEGHYFWDTEVYVVPFLTYTQPALARNVLHFRR